MFELKKNPCANCGKEVPVKIAVESYKKYGYIYCNDDCRFNREAMFF